MSSFRDCSGKFSKKYATPFVIMFSIFSRYSWSENSVVNRYGGLNSDPGSNIVLFSFASAHTVSLVFSNLKLCGSIALSAAVMIFLIVCINHDLFVVG